MFGEHIASVKSAIIGVCIRVVMTVFLPRYSRFAVPPHKEIKINTSELTTAMFPYAGADLAAKSTASIRQTNFACLTTKSSEFLAPLTTNTKIFTYI